LSLSSCNAFFSSSWEATSYAAQFAVAMKTDPFLGNFQTYEPRVTCIHLCDPTFSGTDHPCRGTVDTCLFPRQLNFDADSRPKATRCCWRVDVRVHQQHAKDTSGFMIQLEEHQGLVNDQKFDIDMAEQVRLKVFRVRATTSQWNAANFQRVATAVKAWYNSECADDTMETIQI